MKILYVTTIGITMGFFKSLIKELIDEGHTVDLACNAEVSPVPLFYEELGCRIHQIDCSRAPLHKANIQAIKQIRRLVEENHYDIVHCHTPVAAACTRLACRNLRKKQGVKVFYTAHGFHFYKGAPLKNWMLYYPVEKLCARYTDKLITINQEDFALAQKKMKAKEILYVPGVGIDVARFRDTVVDRNLKRQELKIPENAFLLLSVGELNKNKNHQIIIRAMAKIKQTKIHYMIAGVGHLRDELENLAKETGVSDRVHLLGYRNDVAELYKVSDVFCFPSFREGLSVSVMEAMASGIKLIVSDIRGNTDLVQGRKNGLVCPPGDLDSFIRAIQDMMDPAYAETLITLDEQMRLYDRETVQMMIMRAYDEI